MFVRFGRRRPDALPGSLKTEQPEAAASSTDLQPLLRAIEAAARRVYGRHGLPQRPGHYRRPTDGGVWEPLGDALTPAEKWALIEAASGQGNWRYCSLEAMGAHSDIPAVGQASAILAACQGLRQRLSDHAVISPQDLADSIRLGEAWGRLAEDANQDGSGPLHFLPPDED